MEILNNVGKTATINCIGSFVDNQGDTIVFDSTYEKRPVTFIIGKGNVIKGIEEAVSGMSVGEKKDFVFPPEKAFGKYDKNKIESIPLSNIENSDSLAIGQFLTFNDQYGTAGAGQILKINETDFLFDFNHPFAGKTINYTIELLSLE